jgi:hypothetical protein
VILLPPFFAASDWALRRAMLQKLKPMQFPLESNHGLFCPEFHPLQGHSL